MSIWLCSDDSEKVPSTAKARIFQELMERADKVKCYRSDLYHDAHWLGEMLDRPMTFYYGTRDTGTSIGTDRDLVALSNDEVWQMEVCRSSKGTWTLFVRSDRITFKGELA